MNTLISGCARLLGDDIDTDQLAPGRSITEPLEHRLSVMLPNHRPVAEAVQSGDFIVAGRNFGCGSSREQAVENLMALGIRCVIAKSFARIFFRNAIANALPVLICPGIAEASEEGDELRFEWGGFTVTNASKGIEERAAPYTDDMRAIIRDGGMIQMLARKNQS